MKLSRIPLLVLALAGCAPAQRDIAVFGTDIPMQQAHTLPSPVLLGPVDAANVYLSRDLLYRRDDADQGLAGYADSRWFAPPPEMLAGQLNRASQNTIRQPDSAVQNARCALNIELKNFEQVFTAAHASHAELRAQASLLHLRQHLTLKRQEIVVHIPAVTPDAHGGAHALTKATGEASQQIIAWLRQTLADPATQSVCR